ncbi:GNAT family N-acetyltransferase, partial [Candidatus Woesearchaeota archaeon]|nr:GNAT family N-acetyltransferase [Candidatus Woesearchaeota archaeon]
EGHTLRLRAEGEYLIINAQIDLVPSEEPAEAAAVKKAVSIEDEFGRAVGDFFWELGKHILYRAAIDIGMTAVVFGGINVGMYFLLKYLNYLDHPAGKVIFGTAVALQVGYFFQSGIKWLLSKPARFLSPSLEDRVNLLLQDPNRRVEIGGFGEGAIDILAEKVKDGFGFTGNHKEAILALRDISRKNPRLIAYTAPILAGALYKTGYHPEILETLGNIGRYAKDSSPKIVTYYRDFNSKLSKKDKEEVIKALFKIDPEAAITLSLDEYPFASEQEKIDIENVILQYPNEAIPILLKRIELAPILKNPQDAAYILTLFGEQTLPHLIKSLKNPNLTLVASNLIGKLGSGGREAVPALMEFLRAGAETIYYSEHITVREYENREAATKALAAVLGKDSIPIFMDLLKNDEDPFRNFYVARMAEFGPDAKAAFPKMKELLLQRKRYGDFESTRQERDNELKAEIAASLHLIDPEASVPVLVEALSDPSIQFPEAEVVYSAIISLGELGEKAKPALPALQEEYKYNRPKERGFIIEAISKILGIEALPMFREMMEPKEEMSVDALRAMREQIMEGIVNLLPHGRAVAELKSIALNQKYIYETRSYAIEELAKGGQAAVPALIEIQDYYLKNREKDYTNVNLFNEAIDSIQKIGPKAGEAVPPMLAYIGSLEDPTPRAGMTRIRYETALVAILGRKAVTEIIYGLYNKEFDSEYLTALSYYAESRKTINHNRLPYYMFVLNYNLERLKEIPNAQNKKKEVLRLIKEADENYIEFFRRIYYNEPVRNYEIYPSYLRSIDTDYEGSLDNLRVLMKVPNDYPEEEILREIDEKITTVDIVQSVKSFEFVAKDVEMTLEPELEAALKREISAVLDSKVEVDIETIKKKIEAIEKEMEVLILAEDWARIETKYNVQLPESLKSKERMSNLKKKIFKDGNVGLGLSKEEQNKLFLLIFERIDLDMFKRFVEGTLGEDMNEFLTKLSEANIALQDELVDNGLETLVPRIRDLELWNLIVRVKDEKKEKEEEGTRATKKIDLVFKKKNLLDLWQGKFSGTCFGDYPYDMVRDDIIVAKIISNGDLKGSLLFTIQGDNLIMIGFDPSESLVGSISEAKDKEFIRDIMEKVYEFAIENNLQLLITSQAGGLSNRFGYQQEIFRKYTGDTEVPVEHDTYHPVYHYRIRTAYRALPYTEVFPHLEGTPRIEVVYEEPLEFTEEIVEAPEKALLDIREVNWLEDADKIMRIEEETFSEEAQQSRADLARTFSYEGTVAYMVLINGAPAAYMLGSAMENYEEDLEDLEDDPDFGKGNAIYIESTAVRPKFQRMGLGTKIRIEFLKKALEKGYTKGKSHANIISGMRDWTLRLGGKTIRHYADWLGEPHDYMEFDLQTMLDNLQPIEVPVEQEPAEVAVVKKSVSIEEEPMEGTGMSVGEVYNRLVEKMIADLDVREMEFEKDVNQYGFESFEEKLLPEGLRHNFYDLVQLFYHTPDYIALTTQLEGKHVGYVLGSSLEDFPLIIELANDEDFGKGNTMYIDTLAVLPEFSDKKFDQMLLLSFLLKAKQKGKEKVK